MWWGTFCKREQKAVDLLCYIYFSEKGSKGFFHAYLFSPCIHLWLSEASGKKKKQNRTTLHKKKQTLKPKKGDPNPDMPLMPSDGSIRVQHSPQHR